MKFYTYKITYRHLDYNISTSKTILCALNEKDALRQFYEKICNGFTTKNDIEIIKAEVMQVWTR